MHTLPTIIPETLYTSEEVSEYLRLSLRTVQRLLQTQSLPAYKIHGQYRIKGLDLLHYLDGVRQDPQTLAPESHKPADLITALEVSPLLIGFGQAWLPRVQNPDFLDKLQVLRKDMVHELGFIMPGVRLQDNLDLPPDAYQIQLQGTPLTQGQFDPQNRYSLAPNGLGLSYLSDQSFRVDPEGPLDGDALLFSHLKEIIRQYAYELLCRDEVAIILAQVRKNRPAVVEEVLCETPIPGQLTVGQLTQILRYLLEEQVSVRNLGLILEILANHLPHENNLAALAETVRQGLARQINTPLIQANLTIPVMAFEPEQEAELKSIFQPPGPTPEQTQWAQRLLKSLTQDNLPQVLICAVEIRRKIAQIISRKHPQLKVLSYQEIAKETQIELVHTLSL